MATREEWLKKCWKETINGAMEEHWIENNIRQSDKDPDGPFADVGTSLKRLLELGASRRDLSLIFRLGSYEAVFDTLYMLEDPGLDDGHEMLHEELISADPSGLDASPGSAPEKSVSE